MTIDLKSNLNFQDIRPGIMSKFNFLLSLIIALMPLLSHAQVTGVNYFIRFNSESCLFEANIIINSGAATSAIQRAQFSSQYTIVIPSSSSLNIVANHMPLQGNQNYGGTQPTTWNIGSIIVNPEASPGNSFYSITPVMNPASFYNNLKAGDTIRLFTFSVNPLPPCGYGVRPFNNDTDPSSSDPGMGGGNFSNGFTIGGITQRYEGNTPTVYGKSPTITQLSVQCTQGISVLLNASSSGCQGSLNYKWTGPADFSSHVKDINLPQADFMNNGFYKAVITDNIGCKDSVSVYACTKPDAGPDRTVSCYSTGVVTLNTLGPGNWRLLDTASALLDSIEAGIINIHSFTSSGIFGVVKEIGSCADTMYITAEDNCACDITNVLSMPAQSVFCQNTNNIQLSGNAVSHPGKYKWYYSTNDQGFVPVPGIDSLQTYVTQELSVGTYAFRRKFTRTDKDQCTDFSNIITLRVGHKPDAGSDLQLDCFETEFIRTNATGTGHWTLLSASGNHTLVIDSVTNPKTKLRNFTGSGTYQLLRYNTLCKDTSVLTIHNLCGCDVADGGTDKSVCTKDTVVLEGTCIIGVWSPVENNPQGYSFQNLQDGKARLIFSNMSNGVYRFIYSVRDSLTDTVKVTVYTRPTVDAGENFDYCEGSPPVTLVAGGAQSYSWSTGQTGSSIIVSPVISTSYVVTGINNHGCSSSDTILITVLPRPQGSIPPMPPCYENDNMQLQAGQWTHAASYHWSGPLNFSSNQQNPVIPNVSIQHSGMYKLTVTSENDCINTANLQVTILSRPLPVSLLSFSGNYLAGIRANKLQWQTSSEINNNYFVILRSADGIHFSEIGKIKGSGISGEEKSYYYYDYDIKSLNKFYYRLRQEDYDGRFELSNIIIVNTYSEDKSTMSEVSLYPNPVKSYCNLSVKKEKAHNAYFSLTNASGTVVFSDFFEEIDENTNILENINFENFIPGIYTVILKTDEFHYSQKLIVVN